MRKAKLKRRASYWQKNSMIGTIKEVTSCTESIVLICDPGQDHVVLREQTWVLSHYHKLLKA